MLTTPQLRTKLNLSSAYLCLGEVAPTSLKSTVVGHQGAELRRVAGEPSLTPFRPVPSVPCWNTGRWQKPYAVHSKFPRFAHNLQSGRSLPYLDLPEQMLPSQSREVCT